MTAHLALPVRLDGRGQLVTVEQDTLEEIAQNVAVILATPLESRVEVPDFGSPRLEFVGPDADGMLAAVNEWEPRATLDLDVLSGLGDDGSITRIKAYVSPHL